MPGLTLVGDQNAQNSGTSVDLTEHPSLAAGQFVLLPAVWKRPVATLATPSDWAATTEYTLGTGASAPGAGQMKAKAFYDVIDAAQLPTLPLGGTLTGAQLNVGSIFWALDTGWVVEVTSTAGSDITATTDFSVTGSAVLPFVEDDWLVLCATLTNVTPTFSATGETISIVGATFAPFDNRWESAPTTGDDLRHHCYSARCTAGLATAAPSLVLTTSVAAGSTGGMVFYRLHPVHLPWHILGIDGTAAGNSFKLQAARDGAATVFEKTRAELTAGYYEAPYFYAVGDDQEWTRFQVRIDGPTTGGTQYARSELREMASNGTSEAAWNTGSGTHRLRAKIRWPFFPSPGNKPTVIGAQIHDGADDLFQACTEKNVTTGLIEGKLRFNGTSSGRPKWATDYQPGDEHEYIIEVIDGWTRVYWDDLYHPIHITDDLVSVSASFKAGAYANTDETTDNGTSYAAVDIRDLIVYHSGETGPDGLAGRGEQPSGLLLAA